MGLKEALRSMQQCWQW